uniref:YqgF/RNase H-like domain-containing protein n=1 Tax=Zea mays TaxID=4577 RepID=C0PIT6_MAIZE|nr:unknown [Zea mays]
MRLLQAEELFRKVLEVGSKNKAARLLGLDVGSKYVGVAISDEKNRVAMPLRFGKLCESVTPDLHPFSLCSIRLGQAGQTIYLIGCFSLNLFSLIPCVLLWSFVTISSVAVTQLSLRRFEYLPFLVPCVLAWSFAIIASVAVTKLSLRRFRLQAQQDNLLFYGYWLYS